jgi:hypothetical protein
MEQKNFPFGRKEAEGFAARVDVSAGTAQPPSIRPDQPLTADPHGARLQVPPAKAQRTTASDQIGAAVGNTSARPTSAVGGMSPAVRGELSKLNPLHASRLRAQGLK